MKIAVTTPTGHVGSAAVDCLLKAGGDIRVKLLGRRPHLLERFVQSGAEMAIGSQDDANYLLGATRDVDALFWVTPPGYGSDNVRAFQNRLGQAAAYAVRTNRVPRVVNLSSLGAHMESGAGPINGLHDVEQWLDDASGDITHLRPGFFFENVLAQLDSIAGNGSFSMPISGARRLPMIAARDIARVAADLLVSRNWSGRRTQELYGPADLCMDEVAATLSEVFGRTIKFVRCQPQDMRKALLLSGMSENMADSLLEMYQAAESGTLQPSQARSPQATTSTTLAQFARETMLPLLNEAVKR